MAVASGRTQAPIGSRAAQVEGVKQHGPYTVLEVKDPGGIRQDPGQFYMISAAGEWGGASGRPYLSRAMSPWQRAGGTLCFMMEVVGPGTEQLSELVEGDTLNLVGPLGQGFKLPEDGERAVLVAGGVGLPPILALYDSLDVEMTELLIGFRDAEHAKGLGVVSAPYQAAVDDGSVEGLFAGRVTELLVKELEGEGTLQIYACGPPPMLEAVRQLSVERDIPAQLALESPMACGYGACFGCAVETEEGYIRLCVDGPVVEADRLVTAAIPEWQSE